jgi:hypothetical protein
MTAPSLEMGAWSNSKLRNNRVERIQRAGDGFIEPSFVVRECSTEIDELAMGRIFMRAKKIAL